VSVLGVADCALLGLAAGLLLDVVVDKVPARKVPWPPRARCANCPEDFEGRAGVPPLAWLVPRRPCPGCGQRLPARYFLVPVATAGLFAATAVRFGADWALPAHFVFFAALVSISVVDLQLQIIPNRIVYPAIFASVPLLAAAALASGSLTPLWRALAGATLAWLALFAVHLVSPGGMGFGDVRLSFLLGLFLGWQGYGHVFVGMFLGFLLGAVVGGGLVLVRLRSRTDHVPFGPFLAVGATLGVLVGDPLVRAWIG
jgi:leader peptidase (prepilin peptidase) / N-methyltransferase